MSKKFRTFRVVQPKDISALSPETALKLRAEWPTRADKAGQIKEIEMMESMMSEQRYYTPWGWARESDRDEVAPGIVSFSSESHGGYCLSDYRLEKVHPGWGHDSRWFEEDIKWAIVVLTFPEHFDGKKVEKAHEIAKGWLPDQYAAVFDVEVNPEESRVLSKRAIWQKHEHDWEVRSRFGSWAENVPEGHVGLVLRRGREERCILVSKEVDRAHRLGFGLAFFTDEEVSTFPAWDPDGAHRRASTSPIARA